MDFPNPFCSESAARGRVAHVHHHKSATRQVGPPLGAASWHDVLLQCLMMMCGPATRRVVPPVGDVRIFHDVSPATAASRYATLGSPPPPLWLGNLVRCSDAAAGGITVRRDTPLLESLCRVLHPTASCKTSLESHLYLLLRCSPPTLARFKPGIRTFVSGEPSTVLGRYLGGD